MTVAASAAPKANGARTGRPLLLVGRKVVSGVVTVLGVTIAVHLLFSLVPGGPAYAILGADATPETVAAVNEKYGFDDPIHTRYLDWMGGLLSGDFGVSHRTQRPVLDMVAAALPVTLELAVLTVVLALLVSVVLATVCVQRPGKLIDRTVTGLSSAALSVPTFLIGLALVYVFGVVLGVLPIIGWVPLTESPLDNLRYLVLPVSMLAAHEIAEYTRVLRGDLLTTLSEDYITVARSLGLPTTAIMLRYALRPSSLTVITLAGLNFGRLLGGAVIAEAIFLLPGIGSVIVQGISSRDLPLLQGAIVFVAIVFIVVNLLADVLQSIVDPRSRPVAKP